MVAKNSFFEIELDKGKNRLHIVLKNFWKPEVFEVYSQSVKNAVLHTQDDFTVLMDTRECKSLSKTFLQQKEALQTKLIARGMERMAEVKTNNNAITYERNNEVHNFQHIHNHREFTSVDLAESWLDAVVTEKQLN